MEQKINTVAVYTSGGDAPGMNACIRACVREGVAQGLQMKGIYRGYEGMIEGDIVDMSSASVANIIQRGGTILKTARSEEFMTAEGRKKAYEQLRAHQVDALICIGGNGSYTGAMKLFEEYGMPCIGLPGTIDNDLFGTDYTIGYDTAINTALEAIDRIRDTAHSHQRVFIVEVMGRDAGFIALDVGIAGGAEAILVPEDLEDYEFLLQHFDQGEKRKKSFSIIVISEGDEQGGALELEHKMTERYPELKIRSTILGHVQRGGSPTAKDRLLASTLGSEAVKALLQGHSNCCVGEVNAEITLTSFKDAISNRKSISAVKLNLAKTLSK